jgi:hypothetical protein
MGAFKIPTQSSLIFSHQVIKLSLSHIMMPGNNCASLIFDHQIAYQYGWPIPV